jgi:serine/threonine protein kinase
MVPGSGVFGRYLLHEQVGVGGAGVVWRATDQGLDQVVALKCVSFAGGADRGTEQARLIRARALREARLAAQHYRRLD